MIWNVIRTVIGGKPLIQRIRLHFVSMRPGPGGWKYASWFFCNEAQNYQCKSDANI